jgi:hypothetical protein
MDDREKNSAKAAIDAAARAASEAIARREQANITAIHSNAAADRASTLHKATADKSAL